MVWRLPFRRRFIWDAVILIGYYIGPICLPVEQFQRMIGATIDVDCKLEPGKRRRVAQFRRPKLIHSESSSCHFIHDVVDRPRINVGKAGLPWPRPTQNDAETGRPDEIVKRRRLVARRNVLENFEADGPVVDGQPVLRHGQVDEADAPGGCLFDERRPVERVDALNKSGVDDRAAVVPETVSKAGGSATEQQDSKRAR